MTEVWLRGPLPGIPAWLQPVAHSLRQSQEEVTATLAGLTVEQLWARPGGAAPIGFHVRHAAGALDRLFTYARGETLSAAQRDALAEESRADALDAADTLRAIFDAAIERALEQLRTTSDADLLSARSVGRARLPSNVLGLLFHAAEHTLRHAGQAVTTAKVIVTAEPASLS
jgi:uncharacterized damage-inducible protein DinB